MHFNNFLKIKLLLGFIVLKFYVQTVLDPHFHLDGGVEVRVCAQCVNHNVQLLGDVAELTAYRHLEEVTGSKHSP